MGFKGLIRNVMDLILEVYNMGRMNVELKEIIWSSVSFFLKFGKVLNFKRLFIEECIKVLGIIIGIFNYFV